MNLTDVPPPAHTRVRAATARAAFAEVALLGDAAVLRGRRAGNVILLAGNVPMIRLGKHERSSAGLKWRNSSVARGRAWMSPPEWTPVG